MAEVIKISGISCTSGIKSVIAQIKSKSKLNSFRTGNGTLFSIDLHDESAKIRMVFFNDLAKKHFDSIQFGKWYKVNDFRITTSYVNANAYELQCTNNTTFTELDLEKKIEYSMVDSIKKMELNDIINIIGICQSIKDTSHKKKDGSGMLTKKTITIIDSDDKKINIQIFEENFNAVNELESGSIAAFKNMSLSSYQNEKQLTFTSNSSIEINPDNECMAKLNASSANISQDDLPTIDFVTAIEKFDGSSYEFQNGFRILDIDLQNIYKCCPTDGCLKKMTNQDNNCYHCLKCDKNYTSYTVAALMKIMVEDSSSRQWITSFNITSLQMLNMSCTEFGYLWEFNTQLLNDKVIELTGQNFTAKIKIANNQNGNGSQFIIQSCEKTDKQYMIQSIEADKEAEKEADDNDNDTPRKIRTRAAKRKIGEGSNDGKPKRNTPNKTHH